jgi:hypothetical protein
MVAVNIKRDSINDILTLVLLPTHSKKKNYYYYFFFAHKKTTTEMVAVNIVTIKNN